MVNRKKRLTKSRIRKLKASKSIKNLRKRRNAHLFFKESSLDYEDGE